MSRKCFIDEKTIQDYLASVFNSTGVVPGITAIRENFGGGSFTTYQKIRNEWIEKNIAQYPVPIALNAVLNEETMKQIVNAASAIFAKSIVDVLAKENERNKQILVQAEQDRTEVLMKLRESEEQIKTLENALQSKELALQEFNQEMLKRAEQAAEERGALKEKITALEMQNIALQSEIRGSNRVDRPKKAIVKEEISLKEKEITKNQK